MRPNGTDPLGPTGIAGLLASFVRFAGVGAIGTLAHYATLVALVEGMAVRADAATALGALVGALINYVLARGFVFRSRRAHREALPRFLAIAGFGILANPLLLNAVMAMAGLPYLLAQIGVTGLLLIVNYTANRVWTFAAPRSR